ncbi:MAG: MFS transporter, partial [Rhodobiaceae bacterium]
SYGMSTGEVGTWFGLILGIPGGIGIALGGYLADRFGAKDTRWYLWTTAVALIVCVPLNYVVYAADTALVSLWAMVLPVLLGNFYQATTFSQTQGISSLRMRAVAAGILLFIINIIGLGLGPQLVGVISDLLSDQYGVESLRYALFICSLVYIWGAFHYFMAGRYLKDDLVHE